MLSCFAGPRQQRKLIPLKIKSLCATFVYPMARMTGKNTSQIVYTGAAPRALTLFE